MPVVKVPEASLSYYLIAFDKDGKERSESDGFLCQQILDVLVSEPITDVFLISHGWLGDVPAAKRQYNEWIRAMVDSEDAQKVKASHPDFKPLMIGLHWPSKPYGNEDLNASFSFDLAEPQANDMIENYATEVSDTQATRDAFKEIIAAENKLRHAYQTILREAYASDGANHSEEWEQAEPLLKNAQLSKTRDNASKSNVSLGDDVAFGLEDNFMDAISDFDFKDALLKLPRMASYWKMKNLARTIGQSGGFDLLQKLQQKANEKVRFHLIGHSFGTIVVSSMLRGPEKDSQLVRPVNSLSLIQGAVSLWSYCPQIPKRDNLEGYFYSIIRDKKVAGPIITTLSKYDKAVRLMYPLASHAGLLGGADIDFDVNFGDSAYPIVGGIGTYGIQGNGLLDVEDILMKSQDKAYRFKPGFIYNLNSDNFIQDGTKDAHCAIAKPEVAHAVWSAAFSV